MPDWFVESGQEQSTVTTATVMTESNGVSSMNLVPSQLRCPGIKVVKPNSYCHINITDNKLLHGVICCTLSIRAIKLQQSINIMLRLHVTWHVTLSIRAIKLQQSINIMLRLHVTWHVTLSIRAIKFQQSINIVLCLHVTWHVIATTKQQFLWTRKYLQNLNFFTEEILWLCQILLCNALDSNSVVRILQFNTKLRCCHKPVTQS